MPTQPRLLHEFFDRSAKRDPDRVAVDVPPGPGRPERTVVTYGRLLELSESLALMLREYAAPDRVVGVLLPRDSHWLYAAQLAVLKAGAAYTCIDPVFPDAHVQAVLGDGDVSVVLTDRAGAERIEGSGARVQRVIDVTAPRASGGVAPPRAPAMPATLPENLAYVIYTSGTTGASKGVMIEHRSIVNLVASDIDEFQLTPGDRVGQGSSPAYDSSVEETWLAFAAGATLVVMDEHTSRMGPDLVPWLRRERISVFCPPPTLLRTTGCDDPARALPDLRLLYVGGEALTADLAETWGRGRRLVNGYGPTECTVTVVRGDVRPGGPVTIGRPVPGHTAWVVDAELNPVVDGESGELCLAGIGLARGYRNRDEVTREKFPVHPRLGRIYRTGDLVRREPDGELVYLGRIDAQVKLRGYRVELEAIEACLARCEGVREAACRVQGEGSEAVLAAHIVPEREDAPPHTGVLKESLRRTLPPYMVPARFGTISTLPRSVGGKVDRKGLPELGPESAGPERDVVVPRNDVELTIAAAFASALGSGSPVSVHDDFFLDLGGDSLSAVGAVCSLRKDQATAVLTTRDLYECRTVAGLAERLVSHGARPALARPQRQAAAGQAARPIWVTAAQGGCLLVALCAVGVAAYAVVFELLPLLLERFGILGALLLEVPLVFAGMVCYTVFAVLLTVVLKLALIGEYRPIRAPVWSGYYLRHWIVQSVARAVPWEALAGTVAYGAVLRLLGARVGRRVHIHRGVNLQQGGWDLLTLGDDVTLSRDSHVGLVELDGGCLCVGPVEIGDRATLDIRAAVSGGTTVEAEGYLAALSWLPGGGRIPAGEEWGGVPAAPLGRAPAAPTVTVGGRLRPVLHAAVHLTLAGLMRSGAAAPLLVAVYALAVAFRFSAEDVVAWILHPAWSAVPALIALVAPVACVPLWLAFRALALRSVGTVAPGTIDRWSFAYIRVCHKTSEVEAVGNWLTGTLFWPLWLRLAGMNIGRGCEISTIIDVVPESLRIGDESFFADGIYLGGPRVHRGTVTIGATSLGRGTFLGNHVVIPSGLRLPDDLFLGVCTVAGERQEREGGSWFGQPPLQLPRRDVVTLDRRLTHSPGALRYTSRLFWESLRFALPVLPLVVGGLWLWAMTVGEADTVFAVVVFAPGVTAGAIAVDCLAVVALKWLLLGRARAGQHPLWSCWCSRWDFLYVAWQFYALRPLAALEGTLFLPVYLRSMGVRIGRRVVLGPGLAQVADPDMIVIEEGATVNANYQAHSFEDRVLKLAPVVVRRNATVGESAVLFYGSDIGEGAWVTPNSVVMKNESLAPGCSYCGCPVEAQDGEAAATEQPVVAPASSLGEVAGRYAFLDVARGFAVAGMIYMHFVPAEKVGAATGAGGAGAAQVGNGATALAQFLEGKSAALFCLLAGIAWEIQARRAPAAGRGNWYFVRRASALALAGLAFHILAWPTEILVPFAVMMGLSLAVRRLGVRAVVLATVLLLVLPPVVPALLGHFVEVDWNEDGSHVADGTIGWVTLRALVFDGNYPLVPWLAFPLIGMLMTQHWEDLATKKRWFGSAVAVYVAAQLFVLWSGANSESLGGLTPYLTSTWVPTSLPFVLVVGGCAVAVVAGLALWQGTRHPGRWAVITASFGRASLTHYILHICLVYVPLRAIMGHEEWSVGVGVCAFVGYLAVALPLTMLWFRRYKRGPFESLWAIASGQLR